MPRKRNSENEGLPKRWRFTRNAYYYQVPPGKEDYWDGKKTFKLGDTLSEAYKKWAERLDLFESAKTIGQLLERYTVEIIPTKAKATHRRDYARVDHLIKVFGKMMLEDIEPQHIYQYYDKRGKKRTLKNGKKVGGKTAARHEIALLSHAYTKAVEWGYIKRHPFKGQVRLEGLKPRTRYVEDWEIMECLSLKSRYKKGSIKSVQAYIKLKLLTGLRASDMLQLEERSLKEDGIHVLTQKRGKAIIIEWTDELEKVISEVRAVRPVDISPFLFCNRFGKSYYNREKGEASGWLSMWQRFMTRVLKETQVSERFTEHDLRAKCASDAESLEHARSLLAHSDSKITNRIYRRKPEKVKPIK